MTRALKGFLTIAIVSALTLLGGLTYSHAQTSRGPVELSCDCLDESTAPLRSLTRAECDVFAAAELFRNGIVHPPDPLHPPDPVHPPDPIVPPSPALGGTQCQAADPIKSEPGSPIYVCPLDLEPVVCAGVAPVR